MSCNCGEADECDGEHAVYYPLQPGGRCVVRPCHKPFTVPAAPSAPAADGWQLVPVKPTPQMVEAARDVKRRRLLRAVEDTKAGREPNTMGVAMACDEEWRAMLAAAAAPRPAPAEPQGAEAPQEIKSLRDRIIEGELELDGTHPPTLMFLMAEHWKAVATEHYAKAKDYDRLKHELRLSRTAPAPQPAGGERDRYEFVLAQCREAQDIAASRGWALNDIATAGTTDPRARKIATEALLSAPTQPAAQQERKPLTDAACAVLAERQRQVTAEGWSDEHDDEHDTAEMARAAACYAMSAANIRFEWPLDTLWPWAREWWKPADPRRNLVKAGALILAEIERLDRGITATKGER